MGAVLIIDLRRLEKAPVEGTGVELVAPLLAHVTAEGSVTRGIWVRGSLAGRVRTKCRRCLEPLELELNEELSVLFDPRTSEVDSDDGLCPLDPRAEELDLEPAVREVFLLAVPGYPVCRVACAGLCARCGANLNEGDCVCEMAETDARWAPLQNLRNKIRG
jgi:uncharacterized protein